MTNITRIRTKYSDHRAIQCICDAFEYPNSQISVRARAPKKVLEALMWNRGVHMILAGIPDSHLPNSLVDHNEAWKNVIQDTIDTEVFDTDKIVIVRETKETPNGVLVWFESPTKRSQESSFRKKVLKIRRKFLEFESWGGNAFEPFVY